MFSPRLSFSLFDMNRKQSKVLYSHRYGLNARGRSAGLESRRDWKSLSERNFPATFQEGPPPPLRLTTERKSDAPFGIDAPPFLPSSDGSSANCICASPYVQARLIAIVLLSMSLLARGRTSPNTKIGITGANALETRGLLPPRRLEP